MLRSHSQHMTMRICMKASSIGCFREVNGETVMKSRPMGEIRFDEFMSSRNARLDVNSHRSRSKDRDRHRDRHRHRHRHRFRFRCGNLRKAWPAGRGVHVLPLVASIISYMYTKSSIARKAQSLSYMHLCGNSREKQIASCMYLNPMTHIVDLGRSFELSWGVDPYKELPD